MTLFIESALLRELSKVSSLMSYKEWNSLFKNMLVRTKLVNNKAQIKIMGTTGEVVKAIQLPSVLVNDFIISIFSFNRSKNTLSKYFNDSCIENNQIHKSVARFDHEWSWICAFKRSYWLELGQRLLWLWSPIQERQFLPQWLHWKGVATGGACWLFLRLCFCSSEAIRSFLSLLLRLRVSSCLHRGRSWARSSHPLTSMSRAFISFLRTSLNRSCGRPQALLPDASSPYRRSLGILPPSILLTRRDQADEGDIDVGGCTCWECQRVRGPRCWWFDPTTCFPGFASGSTCGRCWAAFLPASIGSTTRCRIVGCSGHRLCRLPSSC